MYYRLLSYLIPFFLIGIVLIAGVLTITNWERVKSGQTQLSKLFLRWIFLGWILATALITLMPASFGNEPQSTLSLIPFQELILNGPGIGYAVIKEGLANILLFAVGGALYMLAVKPSVGRAVLQLGILAVAVEAGQFALGINRISSVDDVVWAVLGTAIGAFALRKRAKQNTRNTAAEVAS
ncbi:VanZ family protein [Glutamicibacter sp.]|uniref:VanZ family protein n=1 Tax=Glutamicibacter sp. TaxID=1931995 RepID=UPI002B48B611|nr:VanZ family protein [Glutamicibacter sp.]HJX78726.1 VanZ family protein [Glutamicibacter sp.]